MMHGTYIGPITELKGKTALLRLSSERGLVLAQFDERKLGPDFAFGWHIFPEAEFNIDEPEDFPPFAEDRT